MAEKLETNFDYGDEECDRRVVVSVDRDIGSPTEDSNN